MSIVSRAMGFIRNKYVYQLMVRKIVSKMVRNEDTLRNAKELLKAELECGNNLMINGEISIFGEGELSLADNITINSGLKSNPAAGEGYTSFYFKKLGDTIPVLTIGDDVGISNTAFTISKSVRIEEKVSIGAGCMITDTDFHSVKLDKRCSENDDDIRSESVCIKRGAFIGARSIVLKGVTIGEEAVIGAGSVVTKNVPDREVWAGNPAHFIKKIDE